MIEILNLAQTYWFPFLITWIVVYFALTYWNLYVEKYKRDNKLLDLDYKNHDLFSRLNNLIEVETAFIDANYESKKNMARDYIKLCMYIFTTELRELLRDIKDTEKESELYNLFINFTTNNSKKIKEINNKLKIDWRFIEKYEYYNRQRNDLLKTFLNRIIKSDFYTTKIKINIILDNYIKEWEWSIYDIQNAIRDINWELKSVEYKEKLKNIESIKNFI